ncbi:MAG: GDSL-type esterase/lipase family protein [Terracidiphilus sp.]|nr:GDSL-type esterase/lipase family protein [Terracidiphilus sp.]
MRNVTRCLAPAVLAAGLSLGAVPPQYLGTPYNSPQSIPGRLECALYDRGGEGVAYHDTDAVNHGSGELNYQPRHCEEGVAPAICHFREDEGVDISYTKQMADYKYPNLYPPGHRQLYIGWEADGEWTSYTVEVKAAGRYRIFALYSKLPNTVTFALNGKPAAECGLSVDTGDWHIWNRAACGEIDFPEPGRQLLTLHYKTGNNLAYFDFLPIAANAESSKAAASGRTTVPGNGSEISYEGRTLVTEEGSVRLGYPGTIARVSFRGRALNMRARTSSAELYLDVRVDDAKPVFLQVPRGESELTLARDLAPGEHHVEVFKRVESSVGILDVISFSADGGFLAPEPLPSRRLLFLGDSFTAGQATTVEDGGAMDSSKAMRENARLSYGRLLADRFHAQCQIVAYAGRGVVRDWQGNPAVRCAPEYYESALPDDPATRWNPRAYVPDAIGVCLGNNDFDSGVPDEVQYVAAYTEFLRKLRRDAPQAQIIVIPSPSLTDAAGGVPKRTIQRAYLEEIVQRLGDRLTRIAPISSHPGVPGDGHPSGTAHRAVADELESIFRSALNW